jgi:hypothetical protein
MTVNFFSTTIGQLRGMCWRMSGQRMCCYLFVVLLFLMLFVVWMLFFVWMLFVSLTHSSTQHTQHTHTHTQHTHHTHTHTHTTHTPHTHTHTQPLSPRLLDQHNRLQQQLRQQHSHRSQHNIHSHTHIRIDWCTVRIALTKRVLCCQ